MSGAIRAFRFRCRIRRILIATWKFAAASLKSRRTAQTITSTSFRRNIWVNPSIRSGRRARYESCTRLSQKKSVPWGEKIMLPFAARWHFLGRSSSLVSMLLAAALFTSARPAHEENGQTFEGPGGKLYYEVTGGGP